MESGFSSEVAYPVPGVVPDITEFAPVAGGFSFSVSGASNYYFVVEASTNMVDWVILQTNKSPFAFVDTNAPLYPLRFYRAIYFP